MSAKKKIDKKINFLDFKILETFVAVADSPSFHEAAKKLKTAQPTVTMRIGQLEEFLKTHLFERDKNNHRLPVLSPQGRGLLVHATRLIRMRDETTDVFRDPSSVRGIMRLGVSESIVHTWLPTMLNRVRDAYPNLEIEIDVDISPNLHNRVVARELNLALLLPPFEDPNVRSRPLRSFPVTFFASEEIKFPHESVTLEDIAKHRIITFARHTEPYAALRALLSGLHPTIWASASLETVVRLALDGFGIAVIPPDILAKRADARKKLRLLNTEIKLPDLNYFVTWPMAHDDTDDVDNAVRKVVEIAIEVAQGWPKVK
jgi:DNA-binding transcriptional LysR family regulator